MTDQLRDRIAAALRDAARTHPCSCGSRTWASCWHPAERKLGDHQVRRADAVLAVIQPELDRLQTELGKAEARLKAATEQVTTHLAADSGARQGGKTLAGQLAARVLKALTAQES